MTTLPDVICGYTTNYLIYHITEYGSKVIASERNGEFFLYIYYMYDKNYNLYIENLIHNFDNVYELQNNHTWVDLKNI